MAYTSDDIKIAICRRIGDPSATVYGDDALYYFNSSLVGMLGDRDSYNSEEAPDVVVEVGVLLTSSDGLGDLDIKELTDESIIKIINIYQSPSLSNSVLFNEISYQEFQERLNNVNLHPSENEGYWCYSGNKLRYFYGSSRSSSLLVNIAMIKNPDFNWGSNDLVTDLKYSTRLLEACIGNATVKLKQQIGLE